MNEFLAQHWLDILGTVVGFVYIYQEYKAQIGLWITGIIMPVIYTFVYLDAGLYADFGMQIYYTLAAIYGLIVWKYGIGKKHVEPQISFLPHNYYLPMAAAFGMLWVDLYWLLTTFTNSEVPVLDSLGNALSIIGLWALSRKYIEQWWIWVVADVELAGLYLYKELYFTSGLYAAYVIIAIAGYFKWRKMMDEATMKDENSPFDAVILADGDYPTHAIPQQLLKGAEIICCDGAGKKFMEHGGKPTAIVGDGDSLSADFKKEHERLIHHVSEQEDNDLTKATRYVLSKNYTRNRRIKIAYLGCTGKREDHTIGNIALMLRYYKEFNIEPVLYTDYGYFVPATGNMTFRSEPGIQVSIFNFSSRQMNSRQLRWQSYAYQEFWQGTLNEATTDSFTMLADGDYMIYRTYEKKGQQG